MYECILYTVHVQSVCVYVCVLSLTARQLQRASLKGLAARGNVTVHVQYSLHYVYSVTVDMAHAISLHYVYSVTVDMAHAISMHMAL